MGVEGLVVVVGPYFFSWVFDGSEISFYEFFVGYL